MFLRFLIAAVLLISARAEWKPTRIPEADAPTSERWLRCHIRVPDDMAAHEGRDLWRDSITFAVRGATGRFAVWINGRAIAEGDAAKVRRFKVPPDVLEKSRFNSFVIELHGAMADAPILAGYFDELILAGDWEVSTTRPEPAELAALATQPARAVFTEART